MDITFTNEEAFQAIIARIQGDFDNPALVKFGPLTDVFNDVIFIAKSALKSGS